MTNPHIIVGEPRRCLCGMYGVAELLGERPTSCADILAALERQVQIGSADARLLAEAIGPLVQDCDDGPRNTTDSVADIHDPVRDDRNSEEP